jgi:predicted nucleic acid-binding Zn ribbon protein
MERKFEPISLGDAIKEFLSQYKHSGKIQEAKVVESWPILMGNSIASLTQSVYVKNGKLFVQLKSSVLRNELMMYKRKIIVAINNHVGSEVIKELVLK